MGNPFDINRDFESAICEYTGAPYAVAVSSCTAALFLALKWQMEREHCADADHGGLEPRLTVTIPKRTYVSVPMQIKAAGFLLGFRDEDWQGAYLLKPFSIWDSARWFTSNLFNLLPWMENTPVDKPDKFVCVSFHSTKTLGIKRRRSDEYFESWDIEQGGAILHNSQEADKWFRRARFDGRTEGVAPADDHFDMLGWHCYLNPSSARLGLQLLRQLPRHNAPLPNDPYPDLSLHPVFGGKGI
jgi:dTDP-4-amino-4,6-dideoxygalactose transaminase